MKQNIIERLRKYDGLDRSEYDDDREHIEELLYQAKAIVVDRDFSEGSRWYNYMTTVYEVNTVEETAYFRLSEMVPATEMQEGMDLSYEFDEVHKTTKTIIVYE